ncbi:MAG: S8 family serine peptidase, partial [Oscillochloris sp.]|nr:S8 family serine peptidase [Oscillochloris sp.]
MLNLRGAGTPMIMYRRTVSVILTLLVDVVASAVAPAHPYAALAGSGSPLTSTPVTISTSVALGNTKHVTVTIQNTGSTAITPMFYEALAASTASASLAAVPTDLASVPLPEQDQRIDPLLRAAANADPTADTDFLVFLNDQADLRAAYAIRDWNQRGQYVYETLHNHAEQSQADLRAMLDARSVSYTPLWIVNALAVHGNAADMAALATRTEVAMLRINHLMAFNDQVATSATLDQIGGCLANTANVCWNVVNIGADRVWGEFGVHGEGITVANIDSGVRYTHVALTEQYRGNLGNGSFNHNYNWYDSYGKSSVPIDSAYHGTHTMGTMVASGGSSSDVPAVGVAPGARWIAARACDVSQCDETALMEAAQWMIAPTNLTNQNPRPDKRPHIVSNSWSSGIGNDDWYVGYVAAWRAAGIFPVFAAGNISSNIACSSIHSPGDYAQVVGVGALDSTNRLATYSRIGPSADGRLKPDITAPGSSVASTIYDDSYGTLSGTSMATPHVAASVALLWSANPDLIGDYDRTYQILTESAVPISGDTRFDGSEFSLCHTTSTPNNIYGYGQLNVHAAVATAKVDVPWLSLPNNPVGSVNATASVSIDMMLNATQVPGPGTYKARVIVYSTDLSQAPLEIPITMIVPTDPNYATVRGYLTRATDNSALAGTVTVTGGATVDTDANGAYQLVLLPSAVSYTLTATSFGYAPQTTSLVLGTGATVTRSFALDADAPRLELNPDMLSADITLGESAYLSVILRNEGTKTLDYTASLPVAHYGIWRSDQTDGPTASWIDPPSSATTMSLPEDGASDLINIGFSFPFFHQSYTTVAIGSNGILSFSPLSNPSTSYVAGCLPLSETPGAALIPLRVDLDPSQAGARVSYAHTTEGFLVSWENVPFFGQPSQRLSFQILLRPDGRATMNYKQIDALS